MLKTPAEIGTRAWYWLLLIVLGLLLEGVALFYQYVLDYGPCVLCIHARIWVLGFILAAVLGLFVRKSAVLRIISHALTVGMAAGLLERSWKALGVERGTVEGSCSMDSGLPYWFALDEWFPLFPPGGHEHGNRGGIPKRPLPLEKRKHPKTLVHRNPGKRKLGPVLHS